MLSAQNIPLDQIVPDPSQPRTRFDEDALTELAQSIQSEGIIQPLIVEDLGDGRYLLRAGERRWRAAHLAGLAVAPAIVRSPSPNGRGALERVIHGLVENVQRQDLNPIEEARALGRLRDAGLSRQRIADRIGWNVSKVDIRLILLDLELEIQELIAAGQLPADARCARALLKIEEAETRIKLAQRLARKGVTINAIVNACERLVERLEQEKALAAASALAATAQPPAGNAAIVTTAPKTHQPAVTLASTDHRIPAPDRTERWANIQTAAQGMCDACDARPNIPAIPNPAWHLIIAAADKTCTACNIRPQSMHAGLAVCQACPSVELLKRLVASVKETNGAAS